MAPDPSQRSVSQPLTGNGQDSYIVFPAVFYCGIFIGCAIVVIGVWLLLENSPWTPGGIARLVGSSVFGSLLLTGILGTALEITSQKSIACVKKTIRSSGGLFVAGIFMVLLSLPLIVVILSILAFAFDMCQFAALRTKVILFTVAGFISIVLSTLVVVYAIVQIMLWWQKRKQDIQRCPEICNGDAASSSDTR